MASVARSVLRSVSSRAVATIATEARASGGASSFVKAAKERVGLQQRSLRGMSFCVESMMAHHNATASALMTSKLSVNGRSDVWFPQGKDKTR